MGPHNHIILAFITSRIPTNPDRTDIIMEATHFGFAGTGLRVPSTLLLHRMMTVTSSVIQRRLGRLPRDIELQVEDRLRLLFDL
ncbi:MAG: type II toxin-antitoxin system PemK/MazF family toxin [Methanospirillaceae archaeon]|nr:type II toxin-antitoxin system PemK/MazF family toxin [Methanospirillaceae archaeon]